MSIKSRKITILLAIVAFLSWFSGNYLINKLPASIQSSIQNNIIFPTKKLITDCNTLKDEIKNDEKCRWSLNCTMSRNEQVTYQNRKQDYKNYCNKDD